MPSKTTRIWGATVALAALGALVAAPSAAAQEPVAFTDSSIVDTAGALGDPAPASDAIQALYDDERVQLYVAFVDSFTDPSDRVEWANATATLNGFGTDDVLLAVAVDSQQYQLSVGADFALTDAQLEDLQSNAIEPELSAGDWSGAVVATASGIETRLAGGSGSGGGGSGVLGSLTSGLLNTVVVLAALIVVGVVVWLLVRRSRRRKAEKADAASVDELRKQAGSALVATDDAIRTSEQELGFAEAQFGAEAVGAFRGALDEAKTLIGQAFALQQQLDDAIPDTDAQRRDWYAQIMDLCERANTGLDDKAADFDALRDLEKNAPAELDRIDERLAATTARVEQTDSALQALALRYPASATASVTDNVDQAQDRIEFAATSIAAARADIAAGASGPAAVALRAAEQASGQAADLLDAVDKRGIELADAAAQLASRAAAIRADVAQAQALAAGAPEYGSPAGSAVEPAIVANVSAAITTTTRILDEVEGEAARTPNDPLSLLERLSAADATIDAAVAGYRDAQAQSARIAAALAAEITTARGRVAEAEDFVAARRGAVGAQARTRIAEAGRAVTYAQEIAPSDPAAALASAQRASQLAQQGLESARNDTSAFASDDGSLGGLLGGGGRRNSSGAFLGGILFDQFLGGGGGGYRSGSSRSSYRPSSSRSSTRRSTGSFGGSSSRGRRGGGGHF